MEYTTEFLPKISILQKVYGEKAYPAERVSVMWNKFKCLTYQEWSAGIDRAIASNRWAPMMPQLEDVFINEINKSAQLNRKMIVSKATNGICKHCKNTGIVMKTRARDMIEFAFRCTCPLGEPDFLFSGSIPRVSELTNCASGGAL